MALLERGFAKIQSPKSSPCITSTSLSTPWKLFLSSLSFIPGVPITLAYFLVKFLFSLLTCILSKISSISSGLTSSILLPLKFPLIADFKRLLPISSIGIGNSPLYLLSLTKPK